MTRTPLQRCRKELSCPSLAAGGQPSFVQAYKPTGWGAAGEKIQRVDREQREKGEEYRLDSVTTGKK